GDGVCALRRHSRSRGLSTVGDSMMAADPPRVLTTGAISQAAPRPRTTARLAAVLAVSVVLAWAYAPDLGALGPTLVRDPAYSHGFVVVPIALLIGWRRHPGSGVAWAPSPHWGWAILAASLAAREFAYEGDFLWSETATLLPVLASLIFTYGGWPLLRRS